MFMHTYTVFTYSSLYECFKWYDEFYENEKHSFVWNKYSIIYIQLQCVACSKKV